MLEKKLQEIKNDKYSNLKVDDEAADEILKIFEWYEKKKDNLGKRFSMMLKKLLKKY